MCMSVFHALFLCCTLPLKVERLSDVSISSHVIFGQPHGQTSVFCHVTLHVPLLTLYYLLVRSSAIQVGLKSFIDSSYQVSFFCSIDTTTNNKMYVIVHEV